MAGFEAPTINDFLAQLHMQTEEVIGDFHRSKLEIEAMCAKAGASQSSRHVLLVLDAVDGHVRKGVALLLGELRRALQEPELEPRELRNLIGPRLDELTSRVIAAAALEKMSQSLRSGQIHELIATRIEKLRANVQFWLRQFDIGWDEPAKPESLSSPTNLG